MRPRVSCITGQVVKSKFVTTTWWKSSSSDFHISCRGCLAVDTGVERDQTSDYPSCIHSFLFPKVCEALGLHGENLNAHLQSRKSDFEPFDLLVSKFFSDCGSPEAESVIELSTYGKKKVFLAILKPDDATQLLLQRQENLSWTAQPGRAHAVYVFCGFNHLGLP